MRKTYTPEQKAAAVASVLAGNTHSFVSKQMGIPIGTVLAWVHDVKPPTDIAIEKAIAEVCLLDQFYEQALIGFIATSKLLQDNEYLRKYPPSEIAVLFGVLADKWLFLLERGGRAGNAT